MNAVTSLLLLALVGSDGPAAPGDSPGCEETWELTLSEAIRIGLDNAADVRIVCERVEEDGQVYVTVVPARPAVSPPRFKAETMAAVRSIEHLYWGLVQHQAQQEAAARAVAAGRAVWKRARAERATGRGTVADVAEAEQRLERFRLDLAARTSDVGTTEQRLRAVLGLPAADRRRIVPVTPPVRAAVKPDWNACLAAMMAQQPDIAQQRMVLCASALQCLAARGPALLSLVGLCPEDAAGASDARHACSALQRQQTSLQHVISQTTHALARAVLEVEANHGQLQTAARLRAAAAQRLDAQRAFYEEGRIPIDRYLDAVSQQAAAASQEAQFQTAYNVALASLEEARGTLLDARQVTVEDETASAPRATSSEPADAVDPEIERTTIEVDPAATSARKVTFDLTIGAARPIRVRGTITIAPAEQP
jgi:hypothetical protein